MMIDDLLNDLSSEEATVLAHRLIEHANKARAREDREKALKYKKAQYLESVVIPWGDSWLMICRHEDRFLIMGGGNMYFLDSEKAEWFAKCLTCSKDDFPPSKLPEND